MLKNASKIIQINDLLRKHLRPNKAGTKHAYIRGYSDEKIAQAASVPVKTVSNLRRSMYGLVRAKNKAGGGSNDKQMQLLNSKISDLHTAVVTLQTIVAELQTRLPYNNGQALPPMREQEDLHS